VLLGQAFQHETPSPLQALLTIGERSITAALQGGNTSSARRLLLVLMQSDTVVPLLVAGASVRTNAHVQEGLLRLQLQKLRFQLAAHEAGTKSTDSPQAACRQFVHTLNELLPKDPFDRESPSKPPATQAAKLAVTSTGLQPLALHEALGELWQSLQPCLQLGAPLLAVLDGSHSSAGGLALSSSVQLLAEWTAASGSVVQPTWLPALREILQREDMCTRLTQQLLPDWREAEANRVVDWRALLSEEEVLNSQAATALMAAAVSTGPPLHTAWLAFGDWLYARARRARHTRRAAGPTASKALTRTDTLSYCHVVLAYARALSLDAVSGSGADTTRLLLRLLHFAIHHEDSSMQAAIGVALRLVPPAAWQVLAPQLFVQLQHSKPHVRKYATRLLAALARPVPAAVLYTLVAMAAPEVATGDQPEATGAQALLAAVSRDNPTRVRSCRALLQGLKQLTPLAAEAWQKALEGALVEIRRRFVTLRGEAARLHTATAAGAADRVAWQRRYSTMLTHGLGRLQVLLHDWEAREAATPHERTITCEFVPTLKATIETLTEPPDGPDFTSQLDRKLAPLEDIIKRAHAAVPSMDIHLSDYAPILSELSPAGELPLPGTGHGAHRLASGLDLVKCGSLFLLCVAIVVCFVLCCLSTGAVHSGACIICSHFICF
jgi:hypothetical protein